MPDQIHPPDPGSPLASGAALQSVPFDQIIAAPLLAAVGSQIKASRMYLDFIREVGLTVSDDRLRPVMVPFEYDEDQLGPNGEVVGHVTRRMSVPLLALVQHPAMVIEEICIDFEMEVDTTESLKSMTEGNAELSAGAGWGPFSVKITGKVSHRSEQTRKTDTRSRYRFNLKAKHVGQTEGMARVLDSLINASTRPVTVVGRADGQGSTPTINDGE